MLYPNQLEYESILYPTDIEHPDSDFAGHGNIRRAGCGSKVDPYMRRLAFCGKIQQIAVLHIPYFPDSLFRESGLLLKNDENRANKKESLV